MVFIPIIDDDVGEVNVSVARNSILKSYYEVVSIRETQTVLSGSDLRSVNTVTSLNVNGSTNTSPRIRQTSAVNMEDSLKAEFS